MHTRHLRRSGGPVVLAFTGGAGAWPGMGRALAAAEPAFHESVQACLLIARREGLLVDAPFEEGAGRVTEVLHLGVLQIALTDLLRARGVQTVATLALSLGEVPATYAAGALSREDAVTVLCSIARGSARLEVPGVHLVVDAPSQAAQRLPATVPVATDFVGSISPTMSLLLCDTADAPQAIAHLEERKLLARTIPTPWADHTPRSGHDLRIMARELSGIAPRRAVLPTFSAVGGGDIAPQARYDARHWAWLCRRPFYFAEACTAALATRPATVVVVGAHPTFGDALRENAPTTAGAPLVVDLMRRGDELATWDAARVALLGEPGARLRRRLAGLSARRPVAAAARRGRAAPSDDRRVTRLDEVRRVLADPAGFSSAVSTGFEPTLIGTDPPQHTPARRALGRWLGAAAPGFDGVVAEHARRLLACVRDADEVDLVADYAEPLAQELAGHLVGLDEDGLDVTRALIGRPARSAAELFAPAADTLTTIPVGLRDALEETGVAGAASLARLVWVAALNARATIADGALVLADDHALRERLIAAPNLLSRFADEVVRLHPPQGTLRRVARPGAVLDGAALPDGALVRVDLAAANRDPEHFADPHAVRLDRRPGHAAFGVGVHRCPAAGLARTQIVVGLRTLLAEMPNYEILEPRAALRRGSSGDLERLVVAPGRRSGSGVSVYPAAEEGC